MRSASNNEIKLLRKLSRKKYREKEKLFIVEGERAVQQVLKNGFIEVVSVFINDKAAVSSQHLAISVLLEEEVFTEVADTENPQGILALCRIPEEIQPEDLAKESGIIVATDAIQDPGNMGTIIRTAAWFGAKAIIVGKGSVDVYHPKVVRSTAGATGSLSVIQSNLEEVLEPLEEYGWETFLLDGSSGSTSINDIHPPKKTIIIVGNEANGINGNLIHSKRKKIKISGSEMEKLVESLNAGVAMSIALFELSKRQI